MPTIYALSVISNRNGLPVPGVYIGYTAGKISKRLREHRCLLDSGNHTCEPLQDLYLRFGPELSVTILEDIAVDERRNRELFWMESFLEIGRLLNEHLISFEPPKGAQAKAAAARVANGYRPSAESNEKRRLAQLGKPKGHGAKISATKRAKRDEIVRSALKDAGAPDKEPGT